MERKLALEKLQLMFRSVVREFLAGRKQYLWVVFSSSLSESHYGI